MGEVWFVHMAVGLRWVGTIDLRSRGRIFLRVFLGIIDWKPLLIGCVRRMNSFVGIMIYVRRMLDACSMIERGLEQLLGFADSTGPSG